MEDIIIIGAGPVGLYGATLCSLHNLKGLIIESLSQVGGQLTSLYPEKDIIDLPGIKSIKANEYIQNLYEQYLEKGNRLTLLLEEKVEDIISKGDYHIVKTNKGEYQTKTVLITTGMGAFAPRKIGLVNEDKFDNILYSCKDSSIFKNKDVIILGGGDSAVDLSILIKPVSKSTSIIHRRNDFRSQSSTVEKMNELGINTLKNYSILSLSKENNQSYISIKHNDTLEELKLSFDYLLVQYGQIPSKDNFPIEKENNLIKVNDYYQTSLNNVFACGNIITYPGKVQNITTGMGEVNTIITKIDQIINPTKNIARHF